MNIKMEDYKKLKNPITIDVRSEDKYKFGHIPNAINITMEEILLRPTLYLNKSETYYIYCEKGIVSRIVCKELSALEYKVIEIDGGYENFILH